MQRLSGKTLARSLPDTRFIFFWLKHPKKPVFCALSKNTTEREVSPQKNFKTRNELHKKYCCLSARPTFKIFLPLNLKNPRLFVVTLKTFILNILTKQADVISWHPHKKAADFCFFGVIWINFIWCNQIR